MDRLAKHREDQAVERATLRLCTGDNDFVFASRKGEPLDERNLDRRHFKTILERAGLPKFLVYDCRHTTISLLLLRNLPVKLISEMAGHSGTTLTLDTYSHVLPSMRGMAAEELEATGLF